MVAGKPGVRRHEELMKTKVQSKPVNNKVRDVHVFLDETLWSQVQAIAKGDERSVTSAIRMLVKEALAARSAA